MHDMYAVDTRAYLTAATMIIAVPTGIKTRLATSYGGSQQQCYLHLNLLLYSPRINRGDFS